MKIGRRSLIQTALLATLLAVSSLAYFVGVPVNAQVSSNISAPVVTGDVNLSNPGGEAFWSQISGTQIPLSSTNDFGGASKSVTVKMATNGTHILVYATWSDQTQSRIKNNVIENETYPGLFYANSSFAYEDRIVLWWALDSHVGAPPCMQKSAYGHGEGESLAGTGNLWHWKAARTDSLGASFGHLKYGSGPHKGSALIAPYSYADDEFINTTGHYQLGWDQYPTASVPGNFTIGYGENYIPYNTFQVAAHGVYDSTSHTWSWVAARALTTYPSLRQVQFHSGGSYYFAVGIWDGGPIPIPGGFSHPAGWTTYGENEETKSISSWYTLAIQAPSQGGSGTTGTTGSTTSSAQVATAGTTGVDFGIAAVASLAMLVVGFVGGLVVVRRVTKTGGT